MALDDPDLRRTTFVLVAGAWHGSWAWDQVTPMLARAGARVLAPDLTYDRDVGLADQVQEVVAVLDTVAIDRTVVLVGHSYAGLVVRQTADRRPDRVAHIVLVEGWAGPDGSSLVSLAPSWFSDAVHGGAVGWRVPAPPPAAFGIVDPDHTEWLQARLRHHPLRTFTEPTRLSAAVDRIAGTGIFCRPPVLEFERMAADLGYRTVALNGPHDVMLTDPEALGRELLTTARLMGC